jgi:hypothetical protein
LAFFLTQNLFNNQKAFLMHSIEYGYAPTSFANIWQKNQNRADHDHNLRNFDQYTLPPPRIELFKKSPLYSLPLTWNNLGTIKLQNNRTTFQIGLKEQFIDEIV